MDTTAAVECRSRNLHDSPAAQLSPLFALYLAQPDPTITVIVIIIIIKCSCSSATKHINERNRSNPIGVMSRWEIEEEMADAGGLESIVAAVEVEVEADR